MWKAITLWAFWAIIPASTSAWFETAVDTVETHYPNGQLHEKYQRVIAERVDTTRYGFYSSWYVNGQLEWDGQYTLDDKNNTWVHWDSAGRRIEEISYRRGIKQGEEITWNPNGTLRSALHYRNDKPHGLCTWYKPTNDINGLYNAPCASVEAIRFYVDGVILLSLADSTTDPCTEAPDNPYYNAEADLWVEWDVERRLFFSVGHIVDGQKHGVWIQWSAEGDMEKVEAYDHGKLLTF
jgi:YD repeat-containing protein